MINQDSWITFLSYATQFAVGSKLLYSTKTKAIIFHKLAHDTFKVTTETYSDEEYNGYQVEIFNEN